MAEINFQKNLKWFEPVALKKDTFWQNKKSDLPRTLGIISKLIPLTISKTEPQFFKKEDRRDNIITCTIRNLNPHPPSRKPPPSW